MVSSKQFHLSGFVEKPLLLRVGSGEPLLSLAVLGLVIFAVAGSAIGVVCLALGMKLATTELLGHVIAVELIVLALCFLLRWHWLRVGVFAWTAWAASIGYVVAPYHGPGAATFWSSWIWVFYVPLLADVLLRRDVALGRDPLALNFDHFDRKHGVGRLGHRGPGHDPHGLTRPGAPRKRAAG